MADITHDSADDGFHELHLSGKQLVFLFMATTVVAVVIFLCGVQVGRGVPVVRAEDPLPDDAPVASAPPVATPPATGAGPRADEPPSPPAEGDELTYKERLESEPAARESLQPARTEARARKPEPPAEAPAPAPTTAAASKAATGPQTVAGTPQPGSWALQVHALRDAKVANAIVQRLSKRGYPAFLVASGGPTSMYRVFVGRYKDRSEAERVAERLKKEEQFNPWITR